MLKPHLPQGANSNRRRHVSIIMSCIRQTGAVIVSWYLHQAFRKYKFFFQSFELQCNNMSTITTFWWRETNAIWIVFLFFFCVRGSVNYLWLHFKVKTCCTIFLSPTTLQRCPISFIFILNKKSGKWSVVHWGRVVQCLLSVTMLMLVCRCGFWKLENIVKVSRFNFPRYSSV